MVKSLNTIKAPIEEELKGFEQHFRDAMKSQVPLLDRITFYIVKRKGKQVRPMFVFLSAKLCGESGESTYSAASLVELLHTATLVHDDIVDDSYERRGFFSVNALWKNKIAVLVGDYLFSQGMLLALKNKEFLLLEIVSDAVKAMSEGELLQIEKARRLDITEAVYYEIIRQKTASLIASACAAGAASVTKDEAIIERMRQFGENIGLAFQIRDDLFDFGTDDVGKPLGIDIKEKKMTLPLIYALQRAGKSERRRIINIIRRHSENNKKVQEVIQFVHQSGGLDYTRQAMYDYRDKAFELLHTFPPSEVRQSLEDLVIFVTDRKR
ncbi:MAG: polyprenyl synthetase [Saprospiraceae bacterium]|nr:MAG: polyprenyl synthetase [Saprospiraceae bacterium]